MLNWVNATKDLTLEEAVNAYKHGIALEISNGRDITVVIEPNTDQGN